MEVWLTCSRTDTFTCQNVPIVGRNEVYHMRFICIPHCDCLHDHICDACFKLCAVFLNFTCNRSHVCFWLAGQVVSSKQFASLGTIEDYKSGKIDQAESMGVHHKHRQLLWNLHQLLSCWIATIDMSRLNPFCLQSWWTISKRPMVHA